MKVGQFRVLRGPNVWAGVPVVEAELDPEGLGPPLTDPLAGRLSDLLRALAGATPSGDATPGGVARVVVDAALRLQAMAGSPQDFGGVRDGTGERPARLAVGFEEADLARGCLEAAVALADAAARGRPYDVGAEVGRLKELAGEVLVGPTTAEVVAAARRRGIPVRRLIPGRSLFQLGYGARLCRIYGSATDRTGVVSQAASTDKELTKELLRALGLPVPDGRAVADPDDAWAAACEIGPPVVVKPRDYDYGHGITLNISTREDVLAAYHAARERSEGVLVERFIRGDDHRVLVVGGRVVAVSRRRPPQVVGDGRSTVAQLVERLNADPRRGTEATSHLRIVRLDETERETLAWQGYTTDSVPPAGAVVLIRRNSHLRNGGSMTDETDRVHPTVAAQAVEAARALGIDVAGLDVMADDLSRPLDEQGGAILEVNASPGFDLHIAPWASHPRPVGDAFIASLFPGDDTGRIPIVAVMGDGATAAARRVAGALQRAGSRTGLACADGLFLDDRRLLARPADRFAGARDLLANPGVDAAVVAVTRSGIETEGLGFDRCEVAVILDAGDDPEAERCLVGTVRASGVVVLNADDPRTGALAASARARVLLYRASGPPASGVACWGAVYPEGGDLRLARGDRQESIEPPPDLKGGAPDGVALAVAAAAWAARQALQK